MCYKSNLSMKLLIFILLVSKNSIICKICETKSCLDESRLILSRIDNSVDPCENFYEFVCGNYFDAENLALNRHEFSELNVMRFKLSQELKQVLRNNFEYIEPLMLSKKLYKACMNLNDIKRRGIEPLLNLIQKIGGWPVVQQEFWDETLLSWEDVVYESNKIGLEIYFPILISEVRLNSTNRTHYTNAIRISKLYLPLKSEHYNDQQNETFLNYKKHQIKLALLFGAKPDKIEDDLNDVLEFETLLSNISTLTDFSHTEGLHYHDLYNLVSILVLQQNFTSFNWMKLISSVIPEHIKITEDEKVSVTSFKYIESLNEILEMTPNRTIINFIMWRIVEIYSIFLTGDNRIYSSTSVNTPRWKLCADAALNSLPISTNALYVQEYVNPEIKPFVTEMIHGIKSEFKKIIMETQWMDEDTKKLAINKIHHMIPFVAYPNELCDEKKLKNYYANLTIDESELFEAFLNLNIFNNYHRFKNLHKFIDKSNWEDDSFILNINAFYHPLDNKLRIPASFLGGDFFRLDRPKYLNIASLGYIIGHEITHGFDKLGHEYDVNGNFFNWWKNDTEKKLIDKFNCMITQYNKFIDNASELNLNGTKTLNENIADNGGLKLSYRYFKNYIKTNGCQWQLPKMNYTIEQIFWIVTGQSWCSVHDSKMGTAMIKYGTHSLPKFRVNVPMKNMKEFAKDWSCSENSAMNPKDRCEVW